MLEVLCLRCGTKIADYTGPLGAEVPIESQFFTRIDGTQPKHGSSTAHKCPGCGMRINELECTLNAITEYLHPASKREQTEQFLGTKPV